MPLFLYWIYCLFFSNANVIFEWSFKIWLSCNLFFVKLSVVRHMFSILNQSWSSLGNTWHNAVENLTSRSRFCGYFRLKSLKHHKNCPSQRSLEMPTILHFGRNNALVITRISWNLIFCRNLALFPSFQKVLTLHVVHYLLRPDSVHPD